MPFNTVGAIKRHKMSEEMSEAIRMELIYGKVLEYMCGNGLDADKIMIDKYDHVTFPSAPLMEYDVVIATRLHKKMGGDSGLIMAALRDMQNFVDEDGVCYIVDSAGTYDFGFWYSDRSAVKIYHFFKDSIVK